MYQKQRDVEDIVEGLQAQIATAAEALSHPNAIYSGASAPTTQGHHAVACFSTSTVQVVTYTYVVFESCVSLASTINLSTATRIQSRCQKMFLFSR